MNQVASFAPDHIRRLFEAKRSQEMQRQRQQGLGRAIISVEHMGYRFVAVGSSLYHSKTWKSVPDFLSDYLKIILGAEWGREEISKRLEERHPIMQWYERLCRVQQAHKKAEGEIFSTPLTGAISAYTRLAYNLYLIAHNVRDIQTRLIERLKNSTNFQGALYETQVAAELIKAGFALEFENEEDGSSTHCEFTATFTRTGRRFSVEAKSRDSVQMGDRRRTLRVGKHLRLALEKKANHERLVFVNINRPTGTTQVDDDRLLDRAVKAIRQLERLSIDDQPAPSAYVFLTNYSDQYHLDDVNFRWYAALVGFKIADYGEGAKYESLRAAHKARGKHIEMFELKRSLIEHSQIPMTFDGELPSAVFGGVGTPRLQVGRRYLVPDQSGKEVEGVLVDATVLVGNGQAWGVYQLDQGTRIIATCPLTPEELQDFHSDPDTFFGVYKKQGRRVDNPIELFEVLLDCYKDTPKEQLLNLLRDAADLEELRGYSQGDLAETYCERQVQGFLAAQTTSGVRS